MAKSGDLYTAVDELRDLAVSTFTAYENEDNLLELHENLAVVAQRAIDIKSVVSDVNDALENLP